MHTAAWVRRTLAARCHAVDWTVRDIARQAQLVKKNACMLMDVGLLFRTHRAPPCFLTLVGGLFSAISPPLLTLASAHTTTPGPNVRRGAGGGQGGNIPGVKRHIVSYPPTRVKEAGVPYVNIGKMPKITILARKSADYAMARRPRGGPASHGIKPLGYQAFEVREAHTAVVRTCVHLS